MVINHKLYLRKRSQVDIDSSELDIVGNAATLVTSNSGSFWNESIRGEYTGSKFLGYCSSAIHMMSGDVIYASNSKLEWGIIKILTEFEDGESVELISSKNGAGEIEYKATGECDVCVVYEDESYIPSVEILQNTDGQSIEEPIGFDDLKTKIKRSDLHGMSVEVSVGDLEFYGAAYSYIKSAYEADIDSQIVYAATIDGGDEIYSGTIDLSTYSETCGDYCSIKCKVGDIGAKTTFNNRTDTDVDLNTDKTIDGENLGMKASWENIQIPLKHLKYTDVAIQKNDFEYNSWSVANNRTKYINFCFDSAKINEFGNLNEGVFVFREDDDFDEKFGANTLMDVEYDVFVDITYLEFMTTGGMLDNIQLYSVCDNTIRKTTTSTSTITPQTIHLTGKDTGLPTSGSLFLRLVVKATQDYMAFGGKFVVKKGSSIKITMYDNITDSSVSANMINVHNALNVITGAISENALSVKSDWYGGWLSSWNRPSTAGGGHLKAITNGYKIRGLFTDGETERNMPVSFKSMINSLNALDCIGWGFSKEDGVDFVRVERWSWFYKDDVILHLYGANEISLSVDADRIYTDLQIGFKKYETAQQFNSIDSVHGERSMKNAIKVVSKKISHLCEFIGDTYCIEETRRAKEQVDPSESFKYDENIFIFELGYKGSIKIGASDPAAPYVPNNVASSSGVDRPLEQYNVQLSPRRCAERWRSFLFACSNHTPYRFISGKINYKAAFKCKTSSSTATYLNEYLTDFMGGQSLAEDAHIEYSKTKEKAENIKFKYPLSLAEYKIVMENPYSKIEVDGIFGWIKEMQYNFATGEAEFTLIPTNS